MKWPILVHFFGDLRVDLSKEPAQTTSDPAFRFLETQPFPEGDEHHSAQNDHGPNVANQEEILNEVGMSACNFPLVLPNQICVSS